MSNRKTYHVGYKVGPAEEITLPSVKCLPKPALGCDFVGYTGALLAQVCDELGIDPALLLQPFTSNDKAYCVRQHLRYERERAELAKRYMEPLYKTFVNTILGEPYVTD